MLDKIARVAKFGRWPQLAISTSMTSSCGAGPDVASRLVERRQPLADAVAETG